MDKKQQQQQQKNKQSKEQEKVKSYEPSGPLLPELNPVSVV